MPEIRDQKVGGIGEWLMVEEAMGDRQWAMGYRGEKRSEVRGVKMRDRFDNLQYPEIEEVKPTKYNIEEESNY